MFCLNLNFSKKPSNYCSSFKLKKGDHSIILFHFILLPKSFSFYATTSLKKKKNGVRRKPLMKKKKKSLATNFFIFKKMFRRLRQHKKTKFTAKQLIDLKQSALTFFSKIKKQVKRELLSLRLKKKKKRDLRFFLRRRLRPLYLRILTFLYFKKKYLHRKGKTP
jgi:hypothetical protein